MQFFERDIKFIHTRRIFFSYIPHTSFSFSFRPTPHVATVPFHKTIVDAIGGEIHATSRDRERHLTIENPNLVRSYPLMKQIKMRYLPRADYRSRLASRHEAACIPLSRSHFRGFPAQMRPQSRPSRKNHRRFLLARGEPSDYEDPSPPFPSCHVAPRPSFFISSSR